jgi:hypothetical protein
MKIRLMSKKILKHILNTIYRRNPLSTMILYCIFFLISILIGCPIPPFHEIIHLDTGDDEEISPPSSDKGNDNESKGESSKGKLPDYSGDSKEESSTDYSADKPAYKGPEPTFRRGTITPPDSGGPSVNDDLFKRLENLMLEHTQSFLRRDDQEIQSKDLQTKPESELTPEEAQLLKAREQDANFLAYTSSKVLQMESKSLYNASNPSSSGVNTEKRDLDSTDLNSSDNPQNKKSK